MSSPTRFEVTVTHRNDVCVVIPQGELDLESAGALSDLLMQQCEHTIVVDLSELSFIDSTGFGTLVRAHNHTARVGQELVLTRPQKKVKKLIYMLGLDELLGQFRTEWEPA